MRIEDRVCDWLYFLIHNYNLHGVLFWNVQFLKSDEIRDVLSIIDIALLDSFCDNKHKLNK